MCTYEAGLRLNYMKMLFFCFVCCFSFLKMLLFIWLPARWYFITSIYSCCYLVLEHSPYFGTMQYAWGADYIKLDYNCGVWPEGCDVRVNLLNLYASVAALPFLQASMSLASLPFYSPRPGLKHSATIFRCHSALLLGTARSPGRASKWLAAFPAPDSQRWWKTVKCLMPGLRSRFPLQVPAFLILPLARANSRPCCFSSLLLLPSSATLTLSFWNHSAL